MWALRSDVVEAKHQGLDLLGQGFKAYSPRAEIKIGYTVCLTAW